MRGVPPGPGKNFLKVNIDGVWNESSKLGGVGIIIRNDAGNFVAAASLQMTSITSRNLITAMAVRAGLLVARKRGLQKFILKCDSLQIIAAF